MAKRIGLLTGGGDAPGLNFCLKTIVYNAIDEGFEVVGIRKGWQGLLRYDPEDPVTHADNAMIITKTRIRDIDRSAGSFLHSSRVKPDRVFPQEAPPFLRLSTGEDEPLDLTNHIKRAIESLQLDTLIVLGDNPVLNYAARLSQEGVPVIGIPKSVHNDVVGSVYSLGFSSAIGRGVSFVHEIRDIASSREEIAAVTVLGQKSGLATMFISLFSNADRTLIPEIPFDPHRLADLLREDQRINPTNYAILVLTEEARIDPAKAPEDMAQLWADVVVAGRRGTGPMVTRVLEEITNQRILYQPLSYLVRTDVPDGWDLMAATHFGVMAVDLAARQNTGRMTAFRFKTGYIDVPIESCTEESKLELSKFYDADQYRAKTGIFKATGILRRVAEEMMGL